MTVTSSTAKVTATGNGVATSFSFSPVVLFAAADLQVTLVDNSVTPATETVISEGTGSDKYALVVGSFPGTGSITYPEDEITPIPATTDLVMKYVGTYEQQTDLKNQGTYFPDKIEDQFDKTVKLIIQLKEEVDRSVKVSIGSSTSPDDIVTNVEASETAAAASAAAALVSETAAAASATDADDAAQSVAPKYRFDSTTSMADPGTGDLRLNNATVSSVTQIAIAATTNATGNPDISPWIVTWDDSTSSNPKGTLIIRKDGSPTTFAIFSITGTITDNGAWLQIPVGYVIHAGTFADTDDIFVDFSRVGDKGADGAGAGDVVGPASATNRAIVLYSGTTGKLVKDGPSLGTSGQPLLSGGPSADPAFGNMTQSIWVPASAMVSRTTNGAAAGLTETSTQNIMISTLDFDTTTQEFAQFSIRMPKSWNEGTVTFIPVWSHPSTTTNFGVVWAVQAIALSDGDALDTAFGTEQTSTDTGGTTDDIYQGPESSAITVGGTPAEGDYVIFQVKRNPADGSDTLAVDARLHGVIILYTVNTATDA